MALVGRPPSCSTQRRTNGSALAGLRTSAPPVAVLLLDADCSLVALDSGAGRRRVVRALSLLRAVEANVTGEDGPTLAVRLGEARAALRWAAAVSLLVGEDGVSGDG